jgi:uncharacterized delta-60 repeat protein
MNSKSLLLPAIFFLITSAVFSQAGTLDISFGTNGIVTYDGGTGHDNAYDVHVYNDTSMIINGTKMSPGYVVSGILQKFLSDGSIDTAWGTDGIVEFQYGEDTYPYNMAVQEDGRILVSGTVYVTSSNSEFFAARFNPDGTPDITFNGDGKWIGSFSTYQDNNECMTLQPDGKIILAGRTLLNNSQLFFARLNADGTLDNSFGNNGYTTINSSIQAEKIQGLSLLSNGDIVGVGYTYISTPVYANFPIIAKLDPDGNPKPGFGTGGFVVLYLFSASGYAFDCMVVNDSIIITGRVVSAVADEDMFIAKFDTSGVADPDFGSGGFSLFQVSPFNCGLQLMHGGDSKYYVCGTSGLGGSAPRSFLLARYLPNGILDPTFNNTGYVITPIGPDFDEANGLDIQPDGKIVLAGFRSGISTTGDNDRALARYLNDYTPQPPLSADLKVFLDGPFNGTQMNTNLNPAHIPLSQPYNTAPWNYNGTESVASIPNADIVDWVLVEFRDATDASLATGSTMVSRQAAFLLKDGTVVSPDGSANISLSISTIQYSLFAVVWHRNHIGIMSAFPLINSGGIYTYDFTTGAGQVYGGSNGHKELAPGIWGMIGADGNADGQINNSDKLDIWTPQAGWSGYFSGDFNMDVQVNNLDKIDVWIPNSGSGGQVPY